MLNRSYLTCLLALALVFSSLSQANTVAGTNGVVTSRSQIASDVGVEILQQGGNAVDAAVAVGFALAVTHPSAGNIGGGGFMVIKLEDGTVVTQDHREKAPGTAFPDMFLDTAGNVDRRKSLYSAQAAGVPGSVAGMLDALERYGSLSREAVMAPAIRLAEQGFPLTEDMASDFARVSDSMSAYPASTAIFTNNGQAWRAGELWVQSDLAESLKRISDQGRDGFYRGTTADLLVAEMQRLGGMISHDDLQSYNVEWRQPISGSYRGYDIWSMPPPSSGGALVVQMLNMLEPHDLGSLGWGTADTIHLMVEAQRRAYADRAEHMGDPDFYPVPLAMLTDKAYARERFSDMNPEQASRSEDVGAGNWPAESTETTHYSVMDKNGIAVSVTTTLNLGYGNRIVVPGAGFLLNNEMDDFSAKPGAPNAYGLLGDEANKIEPGKRMLSSMTPTIVTRDGETVLVTGSPGGSTIINTVFQVILNTLDHGMGIEEAVASPRIHHQWQPDIVRYEPNAFVDGAQEKLESMGHTELRPGGYGIGDANSILVRDGVMNAASDPRNDGGATAY
ncbi:gamma-glutamyltransferase [Pseudohongiella acticola]|uniref:Glutathione hydrolase proenzyme n=1 Tax=Pseudohongiella acticola TaxID=1524254 RepID=A0A1E8CI14_9GAMM|nr:gamma-glutamyltransferase [Pseudohongiella acticola]OFE11897.1 gamma-glutamyltransferase [Pseudohongiella acticola]